MKKRFHPRKCSQCPHECPHVPAIVPTIVPTDIQNKWRPNAVCPRVPFVPAKKLQVYRRKKFPEKNFEKFSISVSQHLKRKNC